MMFRLFSQTLLPIRTKGAVRGKVFFTLHHTLKIQKSRKFALSLGHFFIFLCGMGCAIYCLKVKETLELFNLFKLLTSNVATFPKWLMGSVC